MLQSLATIGLWLSFASASSITPRGLPKGWKAQGCWTEASEGRALHGASYVNSTGMTRESCTTFCADGGFAYAGIENGDECYCGNIFLGDSCQTKNKECDMPCSGKKGQKCGGPSRLNIFWSGKNATATTSSCATSTYHLDSTSSTSIKETKSVSASTSSALTSVRTIGSASASSSTVLITTVSSSTMSIPTYSASSSSAGSIPSLSNSSQPMSSTSSSLIQHSTSTKPLSSSSTISSSLSSLSSSSIKSYSSTTSSSSTKSSSVSSATKYTTSSSSVGVPPSYNSTSSSLSSAVPTTPSSSTKSSSSTKTSSVSSATKYTTSSSSAELPPIYNYTSSSSSSAVPSTSSSSRTSTTILTSSTSSTARTTSSPTASSSNSTTIIGSSSLRPNTTTPITFSSSIISNSPILANTTSSIASKSSTLSLTTAVPSPTSVSCPASNNLTFTATNGATFLIECGIDRPGGDMASKYASTFTECVQDCAATSGCLDLSYMNNYCYMKAYVNNPASNSAVWGARLLAPGSVSTNSSSSSSASLTTSTSSSVVPPFYNAPSTASTTTSTSPATSGLPKGWSYKGCWVDNRYGRILANNINNDDAMTVKSCISACSDAGYPIAGIEYSTQCSCGYTVIEAGAIASQDSDCAMPCGGDSQEVCGGPNRMSLYSNGTVQTLGVPVPQNDTSLPGSWQYVGCTTDGANNNERSLPWKIVFPNNNTATTCLSQCAAFGYMYGGMEYGDECYCGDLSDLTTGLSVSAPESDCNMACPGNGSYICGAGNRLSLYKWTGKPLYQWNHATGNAAGSYEYFTPGVVVPLITVPGKNGKITFVEKFGTSYFGNSTGAYELDPSLADDFSECWRTMTGIKTDVFCSAGLILPDVAARQINVGGWSADSLYGVRFYTPDGAPGVNSTNMWEEDVSAVGLQAPRWYPSAMMMANGSILIVGGEDGSNGVPTPSLEILPRAGPTLYCEWLEESDPNNLYPYLSVLPSSGIFVAYWNQARILDPVSLETIKTLPQIPGSVTEPLSGRTYPFEGSAVLLPQSAPYTDPLTILLCGGSGPGIATALDNCVSIAPDSATPEWTLERMPSKRVMSTMVALPNGQYLILSGATQGVAGFNLAQDPNLNAVLYDPSQPIGARMTVMANTTIARLYHSEAVLMDDGRVLVSGSDPQSQAPMPLYPEEMRVEVFNPPYILAMDTATRLAFTLNDGVESYGYDATITIALLNGGSVARVSLLGAVASTHGNNMGQRTLFPEFECNGSTCTVTTPPNANVCPPGWFQMFVLDAQGVPSKAKWVRIGGDPGGLGEWPEAEGFTRPGS